MEDLKKRIEELEIELEVEKKKNQIVQEYANYALWEYDIATKRLVLSRKLNGRFSKYNTTINNYQQTMHEWNLVHPDDWDVFDDYCKSMDDGEKSFQYDIRQITDEAEYVWLRYVGESVCNENDIPVKIVGKTLDISEEKRSEKELMELAERDSLTNLYNKEATRKYIEKYIYNSDSRDSGGAFLIIDIDDFKGVNDTWGHMFGDRVLQEVACILTSVSAISDIVGRIGGDEFCLFCETQKDIGRIEKIASEILERANHTSLQEKMKLRLSIGIALFPQQATDYEQLYRYADMALYEAKFHGKNVFRFYREEMQFASVDPQMVLKQRNIYPALRRNEFSESIGKGLEDDFLQYLYLTDQVLSMNRLTYYAVEEETGKLMAVSRKIRHLFPHYKESAYCYEAIFDRKSPCEDCPLHTNTTDEEAFSVSLFQNTTMCFYDVSVRKFENAEHKKGYLLSWRDMSDWSKKIGRLDELTGALSYTEFYKLVVEELEQSGDEHTLVMLGIYGFEQWNEKYGINRTNELLKKLVKFLAKNLARGEFVCRMKGDDIYLFLNEKIQDAKGRIERLMMTFEALMSERYWEGKVQLFAGICYLDRQVYFSDHAFDLARDARNIGKSGIGTGKTIGECCIKK